MTVDREIIPPGDDPITLTYVVDFQNVDSSDLPGPAHKVKIEYTLESELDNSSLKTIGYYLNIKQELRDSHVVFEKPEEGEPLTKAEWKLRGDTNGLIAILAPFDKEIPAEIQYATKGSVTFSVKTRGLRKVGDRIKATAKIYMDDNAPISTEPIYTVVQKLPRLRLPVVHGDYWWYQ